MADQFCDECGVVRDLHYDPDESDPTPEDCESAGRKADLLAMFDRVAGIR